MAKFGIALGSGPRGLGFESRYSDQMEIPVSVMDTGIFCFYYLIYPKIVSEFMVCLLAWEVFTLCFTLIDLPT